MANLSTVALECQDVTFNSPNKFGTRLKIAPPLADIRRETGIQLVHFEPSGAKGNTHAGDHHPGQRSFIRQYAPPPAEPEGEVTVEITEPEDGDTVELSNETDPGPATYQPPQFSDRFKFDIQNGMFDAHLRFNAAVTRSRGADVVAYSERQAVETQITQAAGSGSPSAALFALQYQDANPNSDSASSQVEGRVEFNRMAAQNLNLLASL